MSSDKKVKVDSLVSEIMGKGIFGWAIGGLLKGLFAKPCASNTISRGWHPPLSDKPMGEPPTGGSHIYGPEEK